MPVPGLNEDMPDVISIDHIYLTVSDLHRSEQFYDVVMGILGFRKNRFLQSGEAHVQYFNRHFGYVLRPARILNQLNPYAQGARLFRERTQALSRVCPGLFRGLLLRSRRNPA